MIALIKTIIWIAGILAVAYFGLRYCGYDVNWQYFNDTKAACQQNVTDCAKDVVQQGTKNSTCAMTCVDPKLIINKKK
jgi:hypothetical protein